MLWAACGQADFHLHAITYFSVPTSAFSRALLAARAPPASFSINLHTCILSPHLHCRHHSLATYLGNNALALCISSSCLLAHNTACRFMATLTRGAFLAYRCPCPRRLPARSPSGMGAVSLDVSDLDILWDQDIYAHAHCMYHQLPCRRASRTAGEEKNSLLHHT